MSTQTYNFYETASIPGIPGSWNAGQVVTIDTDTMTVLSVGLRNNPPVSEEVSIPEPTPQEAEFVVDPPQVIDTPAPTDETIPAFPHEETVPIERPSQQEG